MEPLPRNLARLGGFCVALCAVAGLYFGASKAYSGGSDAQGGFVAGSDHVASAKAIAPPPAPTFDEAAIRRIAKEEAQTLVAKAQAPAPARKKSATAATEYTTPSDAGLVYARPPHSDAGGPAAPPPTSSGTVEQF